MVILVRESFWSRLVSSGLELRWVGVAFPQTVPYLSCLLQRSWKPWSFRLQKKENRPRRVSVQSIFDRTLSRIRCSWVSLHLPFSFHCLPKRWSVSFFLSFIHCRVKGAFVSFTNHIAAAQITYQYEQQKSFYSKQTSHKFKFSPNLYWSSSKCSIIVTTRTSFNPRNALKSWYAMITLAFTAAEISLVVTADSSTSIPGCRISAGPFLTGRKKLRSILNTPTAGCSSSDTLSSCRISSPFRGYPLTSVSLTRWFQTHLRFFSM